MATEVGALGEELAHFKRQALDPLEQSRRRRPLVFAFDPRGLRACGSQNQMSIFSRSASSGWQVLALPLSQVIDRRSAAGRRSGG